MHAATTSLTAELEAAFGRPATDQPPRTAWAPYRLSPLGAHTDHQLGLTSGFTLDQGIALVFRAAPAGIVQLRSRNFPGDTQFSLDEIPPPRGDWGDYARGVATELRRRGGLVRGIEGIIAGDLPPGGISTSAALQVAVLLALADANSIDLPRTEAMHLVVAAERHYAGVNVGLLDPAIILNGRPETIVVLDCLDASVRLHRVSRHMPPYQWILIDSGLPRDLRTSPYNQRVAECRAAARALGATGDPPALREVTPEVYRRERRNLDPVLLRRAEHFFSEHKRVRLGMTAIANGDLEGFGRLVTASGESLTTLFECGTPETRTLLELLRGAPDVLGASYAGGGFGGMLQAISRPGAETGLDERVLNPYRRAWPEVGSRASQRVVRAGAGAHVA